MKGKTRQKVWLALAAVVAACLVLAGCPHNGMLNSSGAGGGVSNGGGGRGGESDVKLVITNFVAESSVPNRSASWLNPNRTISPEHVDLTKDDVVQEYVFVATGMSDAGVYGPKLVDIAAGSGIAALPGLNDGYWDITIDAYSVEKLIAANPAMMDRDTIMKTAETDIKGQIVAHKENAVVLSGQASLHLGGSTGQVTLTLNPSSEAKFGDVNVAIHFTDTTERTTIFEDGVSQYVVKARLVDPASYQTIMGGTGVSDTTEVTLFDLQNGGGRKDTAFAAGSYEYKVYDKATGDYKDEIVDENGGKLLQYRPSADTQDPDSDAYEIPAGKYVLLVEVTDPAGQTYYAMDRDFYVEGNRTTTGVLTIGKLLGEAPKKPTGFEVYYTDPTTVDSKIGYDATFVWAPDPGDMAAVSYEIEIANITKLYKNDGGGNSQVDVDGTVDNIGHTAFTGGEALWNNTNGLYKTGMDNIRGNYVTSITWSNQTGATGYPFVSGSLLAGGTNSITLRLESGNVYSARIRATNGTSQNSGWVYFTNFTPPGVVTGTKFDQAEATGIFDLVAITYRLQEVDMYTLTDDRSADMMINGDTPVTNLLQVYEYDPNSIEEPLSYGFTDGQLAKTIDEQVLVVKGDANKKIISSWQGWQDENDKARMFGPVAGQTNKSDWKYSGFTNLTLVPVGAGGSSIKVQVETADTSNVLTLETVGFDDAKPATAVLAASTVKQGLTAYTKSAPPGVYRNTAGTKLVVVLDADLANRSNAITELYVAIGDSDQAGGIKETLTDKNNNPISVTNLVVELKKGDMVYRNTGTDFTPATGTIPAYVKFAGTTNKLGGVNRGQYNLRVVMTTAGKYTQSTEIPVWIVYRDQTANIEPTTFD